MLTICINLRTCGVKCILIKNFRRVTLTSSDLEDTCVYIDAQRYLFDANLIKFGNFIIDIFGVFDESLELIC